MVLYPQSPFSPPVETKVSSVVSADARAYHAALHTAGHLLNWEMRQFGWMAVRGIISPVSRVWNLAPLMLQLFQLIAGGG